MGPARGVAPRPSLAWDAAWRRSARMREGLVAHRLVSAGRTGHRQEPAVDGGIAPYTGLTQARDPAWKRGFGKVAFCSGFTFRRPLATFWSAASPVAPWVCPRRADWPHGELVSRAPLRVTVRTRVAYARAGPGGGRTVALAVEFEANSQGRPEQDPAECGRSASTGGRESAALVVREHEHLDVEHCGTKIGTLQRLEVVDGEVAEAAGRAQATRRRPHGPWWRPPGDLGPEAPMRAAQRHGRRRRAASSVRQREVMASSAYRSTDSRDNRTALTPRDAALALVASLRPALRLRTARRARRCSRSARASPAPPPQGRVADASVVRRGGVRG